MNEPNVEELTLEVARAAIDAVRRDPDFQTIADDLADDYREQVERVAGELAKFRTDTPTRADITKRALARAFSVGAPVVVGVGTMLLTKSATLGTAAAAIVAGAEVKAKVSRETAKAKGATPPTWSTVAGRFAQLVFDIYRLLTRKG